MKGNIDLKDFIIGVNNELISASRNRADEQFFELTEVEMEASFSLEAGAEAEGGFNFFVNVKGNASAEQSNKVLLRFKPLQVPHKPSVN